MGAGWPLPIAETEIEAVARMHGYAADRETLLDFRTLVKAQDREWLRDYAERNTKK